MKLRIELTLERINTIASEMTKQDEVERTQSFATIKVLLDWLRDINREYNHDNSYAHEKLSNIEWSAAAIAGLDHDNGHDDSQHLSLTTAKSIVPARTLPLELSRAIKKRPPDWAADSKQLHFSHLAHIPQTI